MDVLSPFISVLCHSDRLSHGESCPCLDVVHRVCAWSSSPTWSACTCHCSLHYLFLQATASFRHGVTIVRFLALTVSNSNLDIYRWHVNTSAHRYPPAHSLTRLLAISTALISHALLTTQLADCQINVFNGTIAITVILLAIHYV